MAKNPLTADSKPKYAIRIENIVSNLKKSEINARSLDNISIKIHKGEIYGLTGESNSGKTVLADSIVNLIPDHKGMVESGSVVLDEMNLLYYFENKKQRFSLSKIRDRKNEKNKPKRYDELMGEIRGKRISYMLQDSFRSLNPSLTLGEHMVEMLQKHRIPELGSSILKKSLISKEIMVDFTEEAREIKNRERRKAFIQNFVDSYGLESHISEIHNLLENDLDSEMLVSRFVDRVKVDLKERQINQIKRISDFHGIISQRNLMKLRMNAGDPSEAMEIEKQIKGMNKVINKKYFDLKISLFIGGRLMMKEFEKEALSFSIETLRSMEIERPELLVNRYPDELPPGLRHLCLFGLAIVSSPEFVILDEPTSSMDAFTQTKLLESVRKFSENENISFLYITNEMPLLAGLAGRVGILYAGTLIEQSTTFEIFNNSKHPFTINYLASSKINKENPGSNVSMEFAQGEQPDIVNPPSGCKFHPRCKFAMDVCSVKIPALVEVSKSHRVACFLYSDKSEV